MPQHNISHPVPAVARRRQAADRGLIVRLHGIQGIPEPLVFHRQRVQLFLGRQVRILSVFHLGRRNARRPFVQGLRFFVHRRQILFHRHIVGGQHVLGIGGNLSVEFVLPRLRVVIQRDILQLIRHIVQSHIHALRDLLVSQHPLPVLAPDLLLLRFPRLELLLYVLIPGADRGSLERSADIIVFCLFPQALRVVVGPVRILPHGRVQRPHAHVEHRPGKLDAGVVLDVLFLRIRHSGCQRVHSVLNLFIQYGVRLRPGCHPGLQRRPCFRGNRSGRACGSNDILRGNLCPVNPVLPARRNIPGLSLRNKLHILRIDRRQSIEGVDGFLSVLLLGLVRKAVPDVLLHRPAAVIHGPGGLHQALVALAHVPVHLDKGRILPARELVVQLADDLFRVVGAGDLSVQIFFQFVQLFVGLLGLVHRIHDGDKGFLLLIRPRVQDAHVPAHPLPGEAVLPEERPFLVHRTAQRIGSIAAAGPCPFRPDLRVVGIVVLRHAVDHVLIGIPGAPAVPGGPHGAVQPVQAEIHGAVQLHRGTLPAGHLHLIQGRVVLLEFLGRASVLPADHAQNLVIRIVPVFLSRPVGYVFVQLLPLALRRLGVCPRSVKLVVVVGRLLLRGGFLPGHRGGQAVRVRCRHIILLQPGILVEPVIIDIADIEAQLGQRVHRPVGGLLIGVEIPGGGIALELLQHVHRRPGPGRVGLVHLLDGSQRPPGGLLYDRINHLWGIARCSAGRRLHRIQRLPLGIPHRILHSLLNAVALHGLHRLHGLRVLRTLDSHALHRLLLGIIQSALKNVLIFLLILQCHCVPSMITFSCSKHCSTWPSSGCRIRLSRLRLFLPRLRQRPCQSP